MRVNVEFQDQSLELEVPDENLVAAWRAPAGLSAREPAEIVREALERRGIFRRCARLSSRVTASRLLLTRQFRMAVLSWRRLQPFCVTRASTPRA